MLKKKIGVFMVTGSFILLFFYVLVNSVLKVEKKNKNFSFKKNVSTATIPVIIKSNKKKNHKKKVKKTKQPKITKIESKNSNKNLKGNNGINLVSNYSIPIENYLSFMRNKGAKVVVYDFNKGTIICELIGKAIIRPPKVNTFSLKGRRLTNEYPDAMKILFKVQEKYKTSSTEIILLLPKHLDNAIYNNVYSIIRKNGILKRDVSAVVMDISGDGLQLTIRVKEIKGKFGIKQIADSFSI